MSFRAGLALRTKSDRLVAACVLVTPLLPLACATTTPVPVVPVLQPVPGTDPMSFICPTTSEPPTSVVTEDELDQAPRTIKVTRPRYPDEAFAKRIQGTVILEILIDSTGRVAKARVLQSVPLLDAAAATCACQWTFQPAMKDGQPVATIAHAPVSYRIYE